MCHSVLRNGWQQFSAGKAPKRPRKRHGMCTLWSKNQWKPHMMLSIRIWKKYGRFLKSWPGCYSRKWPETDVFREVIKFETVWSRDLPWWCYALNYGRYVQEGPLEWRNVSFCPPEWLTVILEWKDNETARKRHGTCTLWPKNQWKPHKMPSTRIW
jgi:hypothetical protein